MHNNIIESKTILMLALLLKSKPRLKPRRYTDGTSRVLPFPIPTLSISMVRATLLKAIKSSEKNCVEVERTFTYHESKLLCATELMSCIIIVIGLVTCT